MFGMAAFAFEGAGVVIPSECSMKKPEKFNKVSALINKNLDFYDFDNFFKFIFSACSFLPLLT